MELKNLFAYAYIYPYIAASRLQIHLLVLFHSRLRVHNVVGQLRPLTFHSLIRAVNDVLDQRDRALEAPPARARTRHGRAKACLPPVPRAPTTGGRAGRERAAGRRRRRTARVRRAHTALVTGGSGVGEGIREHRWWGWRAHVFERRRGLGEPCASFIGAGIDKIRRQTFVLDI
jgi:hypothetical protein